MLGSVFKCKADKKTTSKVQYAKSKHIINAMKIIMSPNEISKKSIHIF